MINMNDSSFINFIMVIVTVCILSSILAINDDKDSLISLDIPDNNLISVNGQEKINVENTYVKKTSLIDTNYKEDFEKCMEENKQLTHDVNYWKNKYDNIVNYGEDEENNFIWVIIIIGLLGFFLYFILKNKI